MGRKSSINKIKRNNQQSKDIESGLIMDLYLKGHSPITSHATLMGLHECDVLSVSKSDYIYEWEVKISRSDFKKDFIKEKHTLITEGKHTREWKGSFQYLVPNYFYFVTAENLINIDDVPEYAGLIWVTESQKFITVKKAPIIHKTKATPEFIRKMAHQLSCKLVFKKV